MDKSDFQALVWRDVCGWKSGIHEQDDLCVVNLMMRPGIEKSSLTSQNNRSLNLGQLIHRLGLELKINKRVTRL
jgi:hypothetical protein